MTDKKLHDLKIDFNMPPRGEFIDFDSHWCSTPRDLTKEALINSDFVIPVPD